MTPCVAIVVAAGAGERLGASMPKALVPLAGRPMLVWAAEAALACRRVGMVVVAVPPGHEDLVHAMVERVGAHAVVTGGASRQASVRAALAAIPADAQTVAVHDAARPLARPRLFDDVVDTLDAMPEAAGVVPVVAIADTVKRIRDGFVIGTEARDELALAQTPQAFRTGPLRDAHERAAAEDVAFTDDAALVAWAGGRVAVVPGDLENFKVTSADDLRRAELLLARASHG